MRWSITKSLLLLVVALPLLCGAQEYTSDTLPASPAMVTPRLSKNERFVKRFSSTWESLIPRYFKFQFAGSIGIFSVGTGWDYGHHRQWETDVMLGLIPRCSSRRAKATFTLRQYYIPWNIQLGMYKGDDYSVAPLRCCLFFNTVYGDEFWTQEPDRYPSGYYNFSTRIRIGCSLGQSVTWHFDRNAHKYFCKSFSLYYEAVTSDIYVISAFTNKYLGLKDIINITFGVKWQFIE